MKLCFAIFRTWATFLKPNVEQFRQLMKNDDRGSTLGCLSFGFERFGPPLGCPSVGFGQVCGLLGAPLCRFWGGLSAPRDTRVRNYEKVSRESIICHPKWCHFGQDFRFKIHEKINVKNYDEKTRKTREIMMRKKS